MPVAKTETKSEGAAETPAPRLKHEEDNPGMPGSGPEELEPDHNPFTARDWRMWTYAWSGFLFRIVLIVGAAFSAYQYLEAREELRVERTLKLLEDWGQPEYQNAQRALRRRVGALQAAATADLGPKPTSADLSVIRDQIGIKAMRADGGTMPLAEFEDQFDRIVFFLNRVSFCVEENLCSRAIADANFLDFARSFWGTFGFYVERERKRGSPGFAKSIEAYVKRPGAAGPVQP